MPWDAWMTSAQDLGELLHVWSALAVVLIAWLFWGLRGAWWAFGIGMGAAAVKEYVFDAHFEVPPQPFWGNTLDFATYLLGAAIGIGLLYLRAKVVRAST